MSLRKGFANRDGVADASITWANRPMSQEFEAVKAAIRQPTTAILESPIAVQGAAFATFSLPRTSL